MKTLRTEAGALGWLVRMALMGAVAAAIYKELQLPAGKRTWHGRLFDFVPYDFRLPTPRRMIRSWWDPETERLFNDQAFGVGWALNVPVALRLVQRVAGRTGKPRAGKPQAGKRQAR